MGNRLDTVPEVLAAHQLASEALELVEQTLARNPALGDKRRLEIQRLQLEGQLAAIEAELDAVLAANRPLLAPDEAQVAEISALVDQVETARQQSASAVAQIALATRVLDVLHTALSG